MLRRTRREALSSLGALGALGAIQATGTAFREPRAVQEANALEPLAAALRGASRERAFALAGTAIRGGAPLETVLGAVLRVGLEDIRPRPHGILHTVMMVHSSFALAEGASETEAWLAALWNLDDLKTSQARDREEDGDWTLPPRPEVRAKSADVARAELFAALDAWDPERSDRAVVALLPHVDARAFFECMRPFAARCNAFLGHKIIYAVQLERAVLRVGKRLLEPAARSLVRAVLVDRDTATWDAHRERGAASTAAPTSGASEAESALALYRRLRTANADEALDVTCDALADGVEVPSAWDALRLVAAETFQRRSGRRSSDGRYALLPVHAVTVVNALGHAARTSSDPAFARRCLLEAAARMPLLRDWLIESTGLQRDGAPLETLGDAEDAVDLDEALAAGSPERICAHLRRAPASAERYAAHLRTSLLRTAVESHQHKYAAAMLEEASRAHPDLRACLLAPAVDYVAHPADETTDVHARSLSTLRAAGVR